MAMAGDGKGADEDIEPWFRIPTSSASAFFALATLTPPSPDPSISSLQSFDFDDFPVFLVDSVAESSVESSPITQHEEEDQLADSSLITGLPDAESFVSICNFGTFGQPRGGPLFTSPFGTPASPTDEDYAMDSLCDYYMSTSSFTSPTDSPREESRTLLQQSASTDHPGMNSYGSKPGLKDITAITRRVNAPAGQELPCIPPPVPLDGHIPVTESQPPPRPVTRPRNIDARAASRDSRPDEASSSRQPPNAGPSRTRRPTPPKRPRKEKEKAEAEFVWLHGISVDLLIDQEGFRSATPSFNYSGVNRSKHDKATCTVTFRATSKQGYNFHYNPFDSLPILRRVTIHGEESKDYISKQAQLTLKDSGVYSVHGAEISSLSPLHSRIFNQLGHDPDRLDWEFQYLVENRLDTHGRIIDGEKMFVPLTFTCSPWLLHPSQGKRVNLIHIFKKGVLGKLTAEKAEPTSPARSAHRLLAAPPNISIHASESLGAPMSPSMIQGEFPEEGKRTHRRAKSQVIRDGKREEMTVNLARTRVISSGHRGVYRGRAVDPLNRGASKTAIPQPLALRRASSAGEESWLSL